MNNKHICLIPIAALLIIYPTRAIAQTLVFETTSPYHHIQVVDKEGKRTLHFDNSTQSRMSLSDPLQGHFEYTEYFHMPWLWNNQIRTVLLIGLGGGSIQRAYQAYWPHVKTETVELDPRVLDIARDYFKFQETENTKVVIDDGRLFLRRSQNKYDVIILDAYTANRYGSYIPYPLITQEFFIMAKDHLTKNGVLAYNVIGKVHYQQKCILGSIYNTLKTCFPQVYLFPAASSKNVVLIATMAPELVTLPRLTHRMKTLTASQRVTFPNFKTRLLAHHNPLSSSTTSHPWMDCLRSIKTFPPLLRIRSQWITRPKGPSYIGHNVPCL
jgi:spermidine synthase